MDDAPTPDRFAGMSAEEAALRADLAACYRLAADYGWDDLAGAHISADAEAQVAGRTRSSKSRAGLTWRGLRNRLDRRDPSYRE